MADRHLVEMRQLPEAYQVAVVEVMPGVDPQSELVRGLRRLRAGPHRRVRRLRPGLERPGERFGEQLDAVRPQLRGPAHRGRFGVDEQADADAVGAQARRWLPRSDATGVSVGQPPWLVTSPASTGTSVH